MKRELRRDSRRYKENKAKLRRHKDLLIQKRKSEMKAAAAASASSHNESQPARKLKKITEGLPQIPRHDLDTETTSHNDVHSFSVPILSSLRYTSNDSYNETKRAKLSAFASISPMGNLPASSSSLNSTLNNIDRMSLPISRSTPPTRNVAPSLTQSIVNKLPSIGHNFLGDTEELILKNTIKPIKPSGASSPINPVPIVNTIRSTVTQQQQQQQPLQSPQLQQPQLQLPQQQPLPAQQPTSSSNIRKQHSTTSASKLLVFR